VTGTSVLGISYKDGVLLASDTLGVVIGSLLRWQPALLPCIACALPGCWSAARLVCFARDWCHALPVLQRSQ
jgi:hypothetical protein